MYGDEFDRLKASILRQPEEWSRYTEVARVLHSEGEFSKAVRAFNFEIESGLKSAYLYWSCGLSYHNLGMHDIAEMLYRKAIEIDKNSAEGYYYLAFLLIQERRDKEGLELLEKVISLSDEIPAAYKYISEILARDGRIREARAVLRKRIERKLPVVELEVIAAYTSLEGYEDRKSYSSHGDIVVERLLDEIGKKKVHCFGDSHRALFLGLDSVVCHNIGAATAYNLVTEKSTTGAGRRILEICRDLDTSEMVVLLAFGEIDCMEHVWKNAYRSSSSVENVVKELVERYCRFIAMMAELGAYVLVYGPAFSGQAINSYGSIEERNYAARLFNELVKDRIRGYERVGFATLDDYMISKEDIPLLECSRDRRHLDDFPKQSKVFQALVFDRFRADIRCDNRDRKVTRGRKDINKIIPIIIGSRLCVLNAAPIGKEVTRLESKEGGIATVIQAGDRGYYVLMDMKDHRAVDKIIFRSGLRSMDKAWSRYDVNAIVYGVSKDGSNVLGKVSLEVGRMKEFILRCSGTIARCVVVEVRLNRDAKTRLSFHMDRITIK